MTMLDTIEHLANYFTASVQRTFIKRSPLNAVIFYDCGCVDDIISVFYENCISVKTMVSSFRTKFEPLIALIVRMSAALLLCCSRINQSKLGKDCP